MSRRARTRAQRPVYLNAVQIAISRATRLSADDVAGQRALVKHSMDQLLRGIDCAHHWRNLADSTSMCETLAGMGIGCGPEADEIIERAQQALAGVHARFTERASWTLYADEIDALHWLVALHCNTQLPACSYGHLDTALERTANRLAQARAGNASPGTVVLQGHFSPADTTQPATGAAA